jgi:hypothetical protein
MQPKDTKADYETLYCPIISTQRFFVMLDLLSEMNSLFALLEEKIYQGK